MAYQINLVPASNSVEQGETTSFDLYLTNTEGTGITNCELALFVNQPLSSDYPDGDDPNTFYLPMTSYVNGEPITDVNPMESTVGMAIITNNDPDFGTYIGILMEDPNQNSGLLNGKIATISFNVPNNATTPLTISTTDEPDFCAIDNESVTLDLVTASITVAGADPTPSTQNNDFVNKDGLKETVGILKRYVDNKGITANNVDSESATSGQVLTADGSGGASWQTASGGTQLYLHIIKGTSIQTNNSYFYMNLIDTDPTTHSSRSLLNTALKNLGVDDIEKAIVVSGANKDTTPADMITGVYSSDTTRLGVRYLTVSTGNISGSVVNSGSITDTVTPLS